MKYRLLQALTAFTFILLFAGGLVTSTDSGLAVPDWPLSYGSLFPPMIGGIRFEHTHRLIASTVGFLTLILTIWIGRTEQRAWVRWLSITGLGMVVLQGILGGLTVLFRLPAPISVAHACLGPIFFSLVLILTSVHSPQREKMKSANEGRGAPCARPVRAITRIAPTFLPVVTATAVFVQLVLGAVVRHTGRVVGFHIFWAFVVLVLVGSLVRQTLTRTAWTLGLLVILEFFLGISAFVFTKVVPHGWGEIIFPTVHQTLGALILAITVVLNLRFRKVEAGPRACPIDEKGGHRGPPLLALFEITKPRLVLLVLWTVSVGFFLASRPPINFWILFFALFGTALVAAGSMTLNEYMEREADGKMKRTENRPLPSGRLKPVQALVFGSFLSILGFSILLFVNFLTAFLSLLTWVVYLFIYTPLKTKTPLCTLAGAIPGAIPPMIGWSAARGTLNWEAWTLFAILFVWQLPHFFAIAWIYRQDYERAGFRMLSVVDPTGKRIGQEIMIYSLGVLLISLVPAILGMSGLIYYLGAFLLGIWFLASSFGTAFRLDTHSRSFLNKSVLYLGTLFLLMILDKKL